MIKGNKEPKLKTVLFMWMKELLFKFPVSIMCYLYLFFGASAIEHVPAVGI